MEALLTLLVLSIQDFTETTSCITSKLVTPWSCKPKSTGCNVDAIKAQYSNGH